MKESYYFSHDYNATQDPKMIELLGECGLAGVGFYWILIEHLHSEPTGKINDIQLKTLLKMYGGFHGGEQVFSKIQQVLNTTGLLLKDENGNFYSNRVIEHKKERLQLSEKRSFAGKKSAEARQNPTSVQQYKGKERKGKEIKGKEKKEERETPAQKMEEFIKTVRERTTEYDGLLVDLSLKGIPKDVLSRELDKFTNYWCELNKSGSKQRWEMEKTFEVQKRLANWFSRMNKFEGKPQGGKIAFIS
mgnify:CR=1 FL=1